MFGRKKQPDQLDIAIAEVLADMQDRTADEPEYKDALASLERLHKLKTEKRRWGVSPDTMMIVVGNLVGILIIVGYERGHVITTRAKDFIQRPN